MNLEFTSWWWENSEKQMIKIVYNTDTNSLQVNIKDLSTITINGPQHASGRNLEVWDMFVGSEIDILGKFTILKHCDAKTAEWNEKNGKKLLKTREKLIQEIRKYDNKPFPQRLLVAYNTNISGGYNLKAILTQILEFRTILMKYRPNLASQIFVIKT